ncbi:pyridoxamine 5'-phosphate oxidase [Thorsellia anophelis]|uniref:Pyridoxine/pyridoxamine 5'-phosphate oxidase n=1 Tax=Thorsellia anophelis DSM 18579 TaxID=1123402 RepID=A0A1H9YPM9_9GAMM|nr:pyridoxamine 5'-phosphate oxidase [Thorsellia anophelis]SES71042.1 Pyridoxamine 5'-phosphate oxidase [Thorsellia anophelis DSM 18579]
MDNQQLANLRREYQLGRLTRADLTANPFILLETWLDDAKNANIPDPSAFVLGTVNAQGQASQRIVLMKGLDAGQGTLNFFTNYESQKAQEIAHNPQVSILFPWYMIERQVIATGVVSKLSSTDSERYFYSRPKESQIAAIASSQSSTLNSKTTLLDKYNKLLLQYQNETVPFPKNWGGFQIKINQIEFWQGGEHRLHDRFRYTVQNTNNSWSIDRISP